MRHVYEGPPELAALIDDRGTSMGEEVALHSESGELTYEELRDKAARVARSLGELGVQPGDRVATMLEPALHTFESWFGIAWAAGAEVPVNTDYKGEFLRHILTNSGAKAVVIRDRWADRLAGLDLPSLENVIVVGDTDGVDLDWPVTPFSEIVASEPTGRIERTPTDLAYILFTSGTTGPSKGVMQSSRTIFQAAVNTAIHLMGVGPGDVAYSPFPMFHIVARNVIGATAFATGGKVAIRETFSAGSWWDDVRAEGATWSIYMGALLHVLMAADEKPNDGDNPMTRLFGAAPVEHLMEAFEKRFGLELIQGYGSTELGIATATEPGNRKAGTNGTALPHVQISIHDENDDPCPPGVSGEIVARPAVASGIFSGYWEMPDATINAFRNLWFHSGDRGYLTEEGDLIFVDRIKDSLRRRGENISSFEVEAAVGAHPNVAECAAYAVESDLAEDDVMVAIVVEDAARFDAAELFAFCIETMPRFTVPRYIRVMDSLPKTPTHRVQKHLLRADGVTDETADRDALGIVVPRS